MRGCFNYNIPAKESNLLKEWNLIIIKDKRCRITNGENVIKVLKLVQPWFMNCQCLLDSDIEGNPKMYGFWDILARYDGYLTVYECCEFLAQVNLEWGNILLFEDEHVPTSEFFLWQDYRVVMSQTKMTLRAADECYMLIYTLDESIFETVLQEYPEATLEKGSMLDLWVPF